MSANHDCIHEELLQEHNVQLTELQTKSKYKEESIMEIKEDLRQVNLKLDTIISKSEKTDTQLEGRVKNLETKLEVYEKFFNTMKEEADKRTRNLLAVFSVIVAVVAILVKFI